MIRAIPLSFAALSMIAAPTAAFGASMGYNLRLTVPVHCNVRHDATGSVVAPGGAVSLGSFREYCNAPAGYQLVLTYTPGSLRGTQIIAGEDKVELNGSGRAILSSASGPRSRQRALAAIPGANGFDTNRIDLQIVPIP